MAPDFPEIDHNKIKRNRLTVTFEMNSKTNRIQNNEWKNSCHQKMSSMLPSVSELKQYISVVICGILLWGTSWFVFKEAVLPGSDIFTMITLVVIGYVFGHTLERYTTINPVVGMTLVGALCRTFSPKNFLDNPSANVIDFHLRRIYPVIILTKGPLSWNWKYIKRNSVKVFTLATLPWIIECLTTAFLTHVLFGFPWYWGIHLGAILSSVSPAVIVPTTIQLSSKGFGVKNQIALLVANAGGLDTAFTEGMFGVINSAIFSQSPPIYRIVKALLAIFIGIGLGVTWGVLADFLPNHSDFYAPTIRSLHIFAGGIFITYAAGYLSWGGISGVAIMVCAGAAATRWARCDWPINNNPVSEVYKLLWTIFEPMLFTLSGYFLEVSEITLKDFGLIVACIFSALIIRMLTAFLVAVVNGLSVKESIFIAITWTPKAIVEAVLVRVATDSLWTEGTTAHDRWIAKQHANMIVIAILITSTLGSILTTVLGPILLSNDAKVVPEDLFQPQTRSVPQHSDFATENNTLDTLQYIDAQ
ncbi:sodium/hydrogen exchanger 9B2-like isoform X1 [Nymphalis io]|uniref:sodium/hydrogen exchanger 9B2-like isoform X1 n=2 Tax=Inachis io TaxID=171585 RepID=UPI00216A0B4E|nr:sodium/hydrogen exchanger 9B2-like isoform X1 [Nymphalis io]